MSRFGTDTHPTGNMWLYGRRPGTESPYRGLFYRHLTLSFLSFTTTEEAISAVIAPPLKPIPGMPPTVLGFAGEAMYHRGWNGKRHSYVELGFWIPCQYKDTTGMTLVFTYLDSPNGDKTQGGELGAISGRELLGHMKRIGNVTISGTGEQMRGTLEVRGIRLMTIEMDFKEEISPDQLPTAKIDHLLSVKEIPNCDFSGYDVRKVIAQRVGWLGNAVSMMRGEGSIELGHLDTDPLDLLEVVETGPAYQVVCDIPYDQGFTNAYELDDLLRNT